MSCKFLFYLRSLKLQKFQTLSKTIKQLGENSENRKIGKLEIRIEKNWIYEKWDNQEM